MRILIKNGKVLDPVKKTEKMSDLYISDGVVAASKKSAEEQDIVIDAEGMIVCPGFFDLHTHAREPGNEDAENIKSCSQAALAGGFTAISPMPNTVPSCDSPGQVRFVLEKERSVRLYPVGAITVGRAGEALTEMAELKEAGVLALSDDGCGVADGDLLRRAMEYASMLGLVIISHCEDAQLAAGGVMNEGPTSARLGLGGIPSEAETVMVARDIQLAAMTGCRLHIAHVSAAGSVDLIRRAKAQGVAVTAEVTPHHLFFTEEKLASYSSAYKVNPPLRRREDLEALKLGLADGTIDAIATDHAPHLTSAKEKEFDYAPFGMTGLQTALPVSLKALVSEGVLTMCQLIEKLTLGPARVLGLEDSRGTLREGAAADVTVFDPDLEWVFSPETNFSLSENSPLMGSKLRGRVIHVFAKGEQVLEEGKIK